MSHPPREDRSTVRSEVITLRLSPAEVETLDALCEALGVTRSDVIRAGLGALRVAERIALAEVERRRRAHLRARCEPSDL